MTGPLELEGSVIGGKQDLTGERRDALDPKLAGRIDQAFLRSARWSAAEIAARREGIDLTAENIGALEVAMENRALETDIPGP